ncbi:MAG: tyrosine protein phosphatase [Acidobacteriota bacterium]
MIDTHCHILYGLDDGAEDAAQTLAMARLAVEDGVRGIIATPHMREGDYLNERPAILERVEQVRSLFAAEGIDLPIWPGSEVHLGPRLPDRIAEGRLLTCNDRRVHLLLECPYRTRPIRLHETIFELRLAGITPVIAHPERIRFFQEDPARYEEVVRLGALGQMTSSSLVGTFGRTIARLSEEWVARGLVHLLGSDAHDTEYRPPTLSAARERWAGLAGTESADLAADVHPRALVDGRPIEPDPPAPPRRSRGFLARLLGR